ncbi:MAG: FG-GAP-like repeat-containing protein, partial [Rhodothermales bacterium]
GVRERPLFADRQNLPALADIDCDGHLDLFMATLAGFLTYYAGEAPDADGLPAFRFVTDRYQDIAIIGEFGKTGAGVETRHGANGITFNDLDADGDPDLFWGDFFSPSLYFLQNTGTCAEPVFERTSDVFPMNDPLRTSGWNIPHFADIDGDGDADLFAGVLGGSFPGGAFAARNFYYYRHDEGMTFTLQSRQFVSGIDVGEESTPAWVDLDADGDLDLVAGNRIDPVTGQQAQLFLFENEGSSATPAFRLASDALVPLDGRFNTAPAFADLDADGDPDLLLGSFSGALAWYRNDGTAAVPAFLDVDPADIGLSGAGGAPLDVGQNSTPAFADLDADGDLDLLVGESAGTINFFRNTGTPGQPNFVLETESYAGLDAGARSVPALHDLDGDGLFDLIVGTSQDGLLLFRNTGTPQNATFAPGEPFTMPGTVPRNAAPVFADFDADGDDDFFTGGIGGGLFFYRNDRIRTATEPVPDARPNVPVFVSLFPNPFRDAATIHVRLARAGYVRLVVYDALGRVVVRLADGFWASGEQRIRFDARGLPTGVYFYRLTHADGTTAGAMLHVR